MKLSLGDLALKVDASSVEVEKNDGSFTDQASVNALLIQELNDLAANAGGAVTVSDRLPDPSDGDDGEWWIYEPPVLNPFASTDDYEKGDFLGFYTSGVALSTSTNPANHRINASNDPSSSNANSTHRASKTCSVEDGSTGMGADFWTTLRSSDFLYYETVDSNDYTAVRGIVVYRYKGPTSTYPSSYEVELEKVAYSGVGSWSPSTSATRVYKAVPAAAPPDPPDEPDAASNTLFYKELGEWIQIGGTAGGSGGGGVTVSDRAPDATDGSDGEWWISEIQAPTTLVDAGRYYFKRKADTPGAGFLQCTDPGGAVALTSMKSIQFSNENRDGHVTNFSDCFTVGSKVTLSLSSSSAEFTVNSRADGSLDDQTELGLTLISGDSTTVYLGNDIFLEGERNPVSTSLFYKDSGEWITVSEESVEWHTVARHEPVVTGNEVTGQVHYQTDIPHEVVEMRSTLGASDSVLWSSPDYRLYCEVDSMDPDVTTKATWRNTTVMPSGISVGDEIRLYQSPVQFSTGVITDLSQTTAGEATVEFTNTKMGSKGVDFGDTNPVMLLHTRSEDFVDWLATDAGWVKRDDHHPATYGEQSGVPAQDTSAVIESYNVIYRTADIDEDSYDNGGFEHMQVNYHDWTMVKSWTPYYLGSKVEGIAQGDLLKFEGATPGQYDDGATTTGSAIYSVTGVREYTWMRWGSPQKGMWIDVDFLEWGEEGPIDRSPGFNYSQALDDRPFIKVINYVPPIVPAGVDLNE